MSIFSRGLSRDPWSSSGGYSFNSGLSGFSGVDVGNPQQIGTPQQVDNNPLLGNPTSAFDQANDNLAKVMQRGRYDPKNLSGNNNNNNANADGEVQQNPLLGNPMSAFDQANDNLAKVMGRGKYAPNKPVENNYVGVAETPPVNQEQRAANAKSNNASQMFMRDQASNPGIYEDANPEYGEPYQSMGEL